MENITLVVICQYRVCMKSIIYYLPWCIENNIHHLVSQDTYRRIFCMEFNIGFSMPKSNTCKICDECTVKIQALHLEGKFEDVKAIENKLKYPQAQVKAIQDLLKTKPEKKDPRTLVISFDLQQALPVPKLTCGPAFYCRKICFYNFGLHDCTNSKGHMFLWGEETGHRGSDEMCSALIKFITTKPEIENLVVFCDNCPGQNKNWAMTAFWMQYVREKTLTGITPF